MINRPLNKLFHWCTNFGLTDWPTGWKSYCLTAFHLSFQWMSFQSGFLTDRLFNWMWKWLTGQGIFCLKNFSHGTRVKKKNNNTKNSRELIMQMREEGKLMKNRKRVDLKKKLSLASLGKQLWDKINPLIMMHEINASSKLLEIQHSLLSLIVNKENSRWHLDNKRHSKISGMAVKKSLIEPEW